MSEIQYCYKDSKELHTNILHSPIPSYISILIELGQIQFCYKDSRKFHTNILYSPIPSYISMTIKNRLVSVSPAVVSVA